LPKKTSAAKEKRPSLERIKSYVNQSVAFELRGEIDSDAMKHLKVWIGEGVDKAAVRLENHFRSHYESVSTEFRLKVEDEAKERIKEIQGQHSGGMDHQVDKWVRWFLVGLNDYLDVNRAFPTGAVIAGDRWLRLKKLMDPSSPPSRFRFATITVQSCAELDGSDKILWCYDSRRASP